MKKSGVLLATATLVLLFAIGLVAYGQTQIGAPTFTGKLHELLPAAPRGWTMKEKAIADSPEMQKAVGELLNFDDGIFVDYISASGERLSVYIAYWTPGKMSQRLVAGHTPDVCWVGAGWIKTQAGATPPVEINRAGRVLPTGEDRVFTAQGTPEYVWFWHFVGGKTKSYGTGHKAPWYAAITDMFDKGLRQREEQFFIRLSSNQPLKQLLNTPALPAVLERLPWPENP